MFLKKKVSGPGVAEIFGNLHDSGNYRAGMIRDRSPAGINSRIAPRANSRLGSPKSNFSEGSANVILTRGSKQNASPRPRWAPATIAAQSENTIGHPSGSPGGRSR